MRTPGRGAAAGRPGGHAGWTSAAAWACRYFDREDTADPPSPGAFARAVADAVRGLDVRLILEPGRLIAANAGVLLSRVMRHPSPPRTAGRRFLVLDAGMNDLMRPTLYGAFHDIRPLADRRGRRRCETYDVVGPVCETGDTFARARILPELAEGDLVAFMTAGAYGAVMSNEYNSRPLVPEVLVRGVGLGGGPPPARTTRRCWPATPSRPGSEDQSWPSRFSWSAASRFSQPMKAWVPGDGVRSGARHHVVGEVDGGAAVGEGRDEPAGVQVGLGQGALGQRHAAAHRRPPR